MTRKKCPRAGEAAHAGERQHTPYYTHPGGACKANDATTDALLAMLDGSCLATAIMPWGTPGPILVPEEPLARRELVEAHLGGDPAKVLYCPTGRPAKAVHVPSLALAALCPAADGRCRWIAIDLDGTDHGDRGLLRPGHAVRAIAQGAAYAGLFSGTLVARSRRGLGRHVFVMLPEPAALGDAVIAVAALAAAAFRIAESDVANHRASNAFRRADGVIARPGDAGAVELIPHSTVKPRYGWALALPAAGAFRSHGGGVIIDPFTNEPVHHEHVPRCDPRAWSLFVEEARAAYLRRHRAVTPLRRRRYRPSTERARDPLDRIGDRTRAFLDGRTPEGARNISAFAASANLLGCGVDERVAEQLILSGAAACGLPEQEARGAFKSALRTVRRKEGRT